MRFSSMHSLRRLRIAHGIAPARVQQAVIAPRRAVGQIGPLDQRHPQPAQRQVERRPAAGGAAADHQDVEFLGHCVHTYDTANGDR